MDASDLELSVAPAAGEDLPLIGRLAQLYLHDFSEFAEIGSPYGDVGPDGLFDGFDLDRYRRETDRAIYVFRIGGAPAGFALINAWSASGMPVDRSVAEFFVMRKYRRAGVGAAAARRLVIGAPGWWEVPVASYNRPAQAFWRAFAESLHPLRVEEIEGEGEGVGRWSGPILRFDTRKA